MVCLILKVKIKVGGVECMHTHIPILSSTAVAVRCEVCMTNDNQQIIYQPLPIWMEFKVVDWSKVTFHPPNLFLQHKMVEAGIKLACFGVGRCDLHCFLPTTQNDLKACK